MVQSTQQQRNLEKIMGEASGNGWNMGHVRKCFLLFYAVFCSVSLMFAVVGHLFLDATKKGKLGHFLLDGGSRSLSVYIHVHFTKVLCFESV